MDFIYDDETHRGLGALVTLHDSSRRRRSNRSWSFRGAWRPSGVSPRASATRSRIHQRDRGAPGTAEVETGRGGKGRAIRHLEVIDAEIRRLDRVVQTLVDFSRPVELDLRQQDCAW